MTAEILTSSHPPNPFDAHGRMAQRVSHYDNSCAAHLRGGSGENPLDPDHYYYPRSLGPTPDAPVPASTYFQHWPGAFVSAADTNANINMAPSAFSSPFTCPAQAAEYLTQPDPYRNVEAPSRQWDAAYPIDSQSPQAISPQSQSIAMEPSPRIAQGRHDSIYSMEGDETPAKRRQSSAGRRRTENAILGSARAVYLEKNRKAASKCRTKQKLEQEMLVEKARELERTNRFLKADVEALRNEMRGIKELVGQHANCPDSRIGRYLNQEADRLAAVTARRP